jgi:hypothetical protein
MAGFGTYEKNAIVTTSLLTGTKYLALWIGDPGPDAAGGAEVTAGGSAYVRETITFNAPNQGFTQNSATVNFPTPTADWGLIDHWAIFDAATSGNLLYYGAFDGAQLVQVGGLIVTVAPGGLQITVG